ncbi:MAG TPA: RNA polymerase sigma factor [Saprospiraceae bacterium]|jgi:RNA polymerase sigma-70 factor (ECF subfamily)|nr:RNA polymerase sigma factor [Saprospiraceae bacterium]HMT70481.1 RNA polymerase sigma factor [Saprospiraceae bacterium]
MTEATIIAQCKAYNKAAFKELVRLYSPTLMSVCTRYMGDKHHAEDMVQESFIRIFQNILTYQETGSFKSWLCRIAATTCLKEIRKKHLIVDVDISEYEELGTADYLMMGDEAGIMKIIEEIPLPYRLVFNMYVIEGYSHLEIAELLGVGESTSRSQLSRARKMIQALLIKYKVQLTA